MLAYVNGTVMDIPKISKMVPDDTVAVYVPHPDQREKRLIRFEVVDNEVDLETGEVSDLE